MCRIIFFSTCCYAKLHNEAYVMDSNDVYNLIHTSGSAQLGVANQTSLALESHVPNVTMHLETVANLSMSSKLNATALLAAGEEEAT